MKESLIAFSILISCSLISSGVTYFGVKGVYRELHESELNKLQTDNINVIMMSRKLQECSYDFGLYVASKGKYGRLFFEEHRQLSRGRLGIDRSINPAPRIPSLGGDEMEGN